MTTTAALISDALAAATAVLEGELHGPHAVPCRTLARGLEAAAQASEMLLAEIEELRAALAALVPTAESVATYRHDTAEHAAPAPEAQGCASVQLSVDWVRAQFHGATSVLRGLTSELERAGGPLRAYAVDMIDYVKELERLGASAERAVRRG